MESGLAVPRLDGGAGQYSEGALLTATGIFRGPGTLHPTLSNSAILLLSTPIPYAHKGAPWRPSPSFYWRTMAGYSTPTIT